MRYSGEVGQREVIRRVVVEIMCEVVDSIFVGGWSGRGIWGGGSACC